MKKFFGNLLLFGVSIGIALLVGEVFIRIAAPQQLTQLPDTGWKPDPIFGMRHHANVNMPINTGEQRVQFVTDAKGYRINQDADSSATPAFSIIGIGDSFVEGLQTENRDTITGWLARILTDSMAVPVEVVNAGMSAWTPNQYYLEAQRALSEEAYNMGVVFIYVGNDCISAVDTTDAFEHTMYRSFRLPENLSSGELMNAFVLPLNDFLESRSHMFVFVRSRSEELLAKLGFSRYYVPAMFRVDTVGESCWDVVGHLSELTDATFKRSEREVVFVLLPAIYQVYEEAFDTYMASMGIPADSVDVDQPQAKLYAALADRGLEVYDALPAFRAEAAKGIQLFGSYDHHFSAEGNRVTAEVTTAAVLQRLRALQLGRSSSSVVNE